MCKLGFNVRDMDGANEFAGDKFENPVSRAIIALPHEHTAKRLGREFVHVEVLQAEVGRAAEDFDVGEVSGDAMEDDVREARITVGVGRCGEVVV
jgi:hypothetical protein